MTELEEKIGLLVDALLENMPRRTSDRYCVGDTDTILAGTQLTVTFTLGKQWVVRLVKAYADARTGCTYTWVIDGNAYSLNEVEFYLGKPINQDIKLIIANASAVSVDIGYSIQGWGDLRSGG